MSTGCLAISLTSPNWGTGNDTAAMAEVVAAPGSGARRAAINVPLGINDVPREVTLEAGDYLVRVYMPSGDVQAERIQLFDGAHEELHFDIDPSPHAWLAAAASLGVVQTLPRPSEARSLEDAIGHSKPAIFRSGQVIQGSMIFDQSLLRSSDLKELAGLAVVSLDRTTDALERISGAQRVKQAEGWRWIAQVDPNRPWPLERLSIRELASWWTGNAVQSPTPMTIVQSDERNARLAYMSPDHALPMHPRETRAFVEVRDPIGDSFYAVFPEGWASVSRSRIGQLSLPSVLLTVVVDTAMSTADSLTSPARWRCSPEIDDVEAMSLLGFLHSGQIEAGQVMLDRARDWLFEKTVNPVAAAAGAYLLLSHTDEANARLAHEWRRWVENLYSWFPTMPDGAITMAKMVLAYGESGRGDEIDLDKLRHYALEAVRRGLPFLGIGLRVLTEILLALDGDDKAEGRTGAAVQDTRRALSLVHQLGRITVPGEFFTTLRLSEAQL